MGINTDAVQRLYVAYFNRPADPAGLAYWESQLSSTVTATQAELEAIASGFSGSAEYAALYAGQTNAQIIDSLYMNLFSRHVESTAVLNAWAGWLTDGTYTFAQIALQLTYSAQGTDATAIANKLAASTAFTAALDTTAEIAGYAGTTAAAMARTWLASATVDGTTHTTAEVQAALTTATASVATTINSIVTTSAGMGTISTAGEVDSISYTMVAGHSYRIEVQATAGSLLDPEIVRVLDPAQTAIPSAANADYGLSQNAQLTITPTVDGSYSIDVQGQNSSTGEYIVQVTDLDAASTSNDTQATITAGQTYAGTVSQSFETRAVFFSLTGDQEYQFTLQTATSGDVLNTPVLQGIYDETGKQISGSYGQASGGALTLNVTPTGTGTYYAVIADSYDDTGGFSFAFNAAATAKTGTTYALAAATVVPATYALTIPATTSTTASITSNGSVTGTIDASGDQDWYSIYMYAGATYTVSLQGQATSAGTLYDPYLNGIYNSAGTYITNTANDDGGTGRDAQVSFTPTTSGTYYIAASAYQFYTGTYTLSVAATGESTASDDYAASTSTTGSVTSGSSTTGNIETDGDNDWIAAYLYSGYAYQFNLRGASSSGGTLSDPVISSICDASGTSLSSTYDDDSGTGYDSLISFTPTSTGYYYLVARSVGSTGTGTYTLGLTATSSDDYAATTSTTGSIAAGGSVTGSIETSGDQDWYRISMTAGTAYTVRLQGQGASAGTLYDPVIQGIYDSTGTYVTNTYSDDSSAGGGTTYRDSLVTFTPTASGTYYIAADAYSSYTGTYTLSVSGTSNAEGDSVAGNTSTTATVAVGSSVTGTIGSATDADWYAVSLTAGYIYTIQLQGSGSSNGTLSDPLISGIYNSSGSYISNTYADDQNGRDSSLSFAPTTSGTYYIAAEGYGSYTGTFLLSVQQTSADAAGSTSTTSSVSTGGSASVTIDQAYDHDWYAVSLTGGNTYQFTLSGTGTNAWPTIYGIYNSAGSYVEGYAGGVTSGSTTTATATFTPTTSGTYYIDAYSYYAGSYTLSMAQTTTDIAASTATTGSVSVGGSVTGTIDSAADADWYAVSLTAGSAYTIRLQGSGSGNGTLSDPLISGIYDSTGTYISNTYADDQDGRDSSLSFTPTASGTYYVAAEGYGSYTGTFLLSVSQAVSNDIAASTATTGSVSAGNSVTGAIDTAADADWYAVSLTAGNAYTIRLQGSGSGNGTLSDPLISGLYDSSGTLVSNTYADDQDGRDSSLSFTPTASGTYYIAAEGYGSSTGTFRLSVEQQVSADLAASILTTGIVLANSSVTGTIDIASDQDWFAVSLNADTRYQIDLQGLPSSAGTLTDTYLRGVYDSAGTLISGTTDDDSGQGYDSRVTLDISSAGTYYIAAGAYGSNTGTYTLAVTSQGSTDIAADSTTTATVTPGGSVDGLVGQTGDRDWFAISLTAGQSYTIDLQPKSNSTAPLLDPYLYGLYSSAGSLISGTTDDDSGAGYGAQITYTATASGTYYISAGGYSSNTGNYVLSVSSGTSGSSGGATTTTDLAASTATTGTVSTGASAASLIDTAADQDWFSVSLSAGRSYDIGLGGSASNNGSLTDPYLRGIYDSAGTLISATTDDDSGYGNDALVSFTPTSTGTYYISAGAFASATGSYTLTVSENAAVDTGSTTPTTGTQGSWTIMVYVDGDNNLESYALSDVNEMEAASLPQNVRVSALVDRVRGYSSADGNWADTRFGLISGDSNLNHISSNLTSWGERNMGDPATLTEFINASALAAPADNYALVIWDHGGGISGVAWDDSSNSANLSLNEVSQAIASSNVTSFGMIGFDACLQGVLDQAYVLRNQADYLVVSQDLEPGDGWDYTNWLSVFQQSSPSARQVATQVVNSYESFYQAQGNSQVTLSVIDTAQVGGVATAWSSFAQSVNDAGSSAMLTLQSARSSALDFQNDTYVDLRSLMSNFMQLNSVASLDTLAQSVLSALSGAVLETGGLTTASGLTVYLPESSHSSYLNATDFPVVGLSGVNSFYTAFWA